LYRQIAGEDCGHHGHCTGTFEHGLEAVDIAATPYEKGIMLAHFDLL
jgi:hypothetical protein